MPLRRTAAMILCLAAAPLLAGPAAALELAAQTDLLTLTPLTKLPKNPSTGGEEAFCPVLRDAPETPAGQAVAAAGWMVSGEITLDGLTFVSFVGQAEQGTSGSCLLQDGNIGIFRGAALEALVYAPAETERSIGSIEGLEGNALRIWDGDYLASPMADLQVVGAELVLLRNVASRDSSCNGAVSVPNIHGLPIHQARQLLMAEGWAPAPATESPAMGWTAEMQAEWPELEDCAGTGFGYCAWNYAKGAGETLSVTTAGESPEGSSPAVVGFSASCNG